MNRGLHRLPQGSPHSLPYSAVLHHEMQRPAVPGLAALHLAVSAVLVPHHAQHRFAARTCDAYPSVHCTIYPEGRCLKTDCDTVFDKVHDTHVMFQPKIKVLGVLTIWEVLTSTDIGE